MKINANMTIPNCKRLSSVVNPLESFATSGSIPWSVNTYTQRTNHQWNKTKIELRRQNSSPFKGKAFKEMPKCRYFDFHWRVIDIGGYFVLQHII